MKRITSLLSASALLIASLSPSVFADEFTLDSPIEIADVEAQEYYVDTFVISAYYSPLPGQERYVTGSLEGDKRLNGNGTNFADGTPVYPGGIAAPKIFDFGTVLDIPGIGVTKIHDRGGAIVAAGNRGYEHHRLDVWMGAGDEGLTRALNWGKRTVGGVKVYGIQDEMQASIYLENYSAAESLVVHTVLKPREFPEDIFFGSQGEEVKKLQQYLADWHYYTGEIDGVYDADLAQAIFNFQLDFDIVGSTDELGAGHLGIKTRTKFDQLIHGNEEATDAVILKRGSSLMARYPDLYESVEYFGAALELGSEGEMVSKLQGELQNLGYLRIEPTGYFGEVTQHALFKFQQAHGLVEDKENAAAGYLGPQTRQVLNGYMESRYEMKSYMAFHRDRFDENRRIVPLPDEVIAKLEE